MALSFVFPKIKTKTEKPLSSPVLDTACWCFAPDRIATAFPRSVVVCTCQFTTKGMAAMRREYSVGLQRRASCSPDSRDFLFLNLSPLVWLGRGGEEDALSDRDQQQFWRYSGPTCSDHCLLAVAPFPELNRFLIVAAANPVFGSPVGNWDQAELLGRLKAFSLYTRLRREERNKSGPGMPAWSVVDPRLLFRRCVA